MNVGLNDLGIIINFDMVGTVAIGLISLFIGKKLKVKLSFLDRFGIPAAVIGGLFFRNNPFTYESVSCGKYRI